MCLMDTWTVKELGISGNARLNYANHENED